MKNLLYIAILSVVLVSCNMEAEEEINWDLEKHAEMLVVESIITNELKQQTIHLTLTNPYFDSKTSKGVSNASITVKGGTQTFNFKESSDSAGWYFSEQPFAGEQHNTYTLNIRLASAVNGLTEYTASSTMPQGLTMDSMKCEIYKMPEFENTGGNDDDKEKDTCILGIYYFGHEPKIAETFYFTKVFRNGKLLLKNPKEYMYYRNDAENASYVHQNAYLKNVVNNDAIRFQLYTIGKDYYDYLEAIQNMDFSGNSYSMSGPPANAVGNVSEGKALGYFLAAYLSEMKTLAIDKRGTK